MKTLFLTLLVAVPWSVVILWVVYITRNLKG